MNESKIPLRVTACFLAILPVVAQSAPMASESRGELLYSTHCIACHTATIHWRDKRLATDWASLKAQVRRWQANTGLGWSEGDILEVARHLNALYYHFPQTDSRVGLANDCGNIHGTILSFFA